MNEKLTLEQIRDIRTRFGDLSDMGLLCDLALRTNEALNDAGYALPLQEQVGAVIQDRDRYVEALVARHGGEPVALLAELDEARRERDAATAEVNAARQELAALRAAPSDAEVEAWINFPRPIVQVLGQDAHALSKPDFDSAVALMRRAGSAATACPPKREPLPDLVVNPMPDMQTVMGLASSVQISLDHIGEHVQLLTERLRALEGRA